MLSEYLFLSYLRIILVVTLYWIVSIVTVFVNKTLLSDMDIEAPFFIMWFQCITSVAICLTVQFLSKVFPAAFSFPKSAPFSRESIRSVGPLAILFASMIGFNTLCLKYVGVSFYYIGRSLTTVFNVVCTFIILKEQVSKQAALCCGIIVMGFLMGVDQESLSASFSSWGILYGLMASLSLALYSIYTKKVLPLIGNHIWLLSYYNNVYSAIIFIPVMALNQEIPVILNYKDLYTSHFWSLMFVGGLCGFSIGYVTSLQIKVTSPLTHNVSGTAKACAQTVIATFWYAESKSFLWWLSNGVVLVGSAAYTSVKQKEMKEKYLESRVLLPMRNT